MWDIKYHRKKGRKGQAALTKDSSAPAQCEDQMAEWKIEVAKGDIA
uniref:Uncharacterized protein n=1 Tax=Arundo donax TaxID=35708 RepID=A0A0A9FLJ5_ARUDO